MIHESLAPVEGTMSMGSLSKIKKPSVRLNIDGWHVDVPCLFVRGRARQ